MHNGSTAIGYGAHSMGANSIVFGTSINNYFFPGLSSDVALGEQSYLVVNSDGSLSVVASSPNALTAEASTAGHAAIEVPKSVPGTAQPTPVQTADATNVASAAPVNNAAVETAAAAPVAASQSATPVTESHIAASNAAVSHAERPSRELTADLASDSAKVDMAENEAQGDGKPSQLMVENEAHAGAESEMIVKNEAQNKARPAEASEALVGAEPVQGNGRGSISLNEVPGVNRAVQTAVNQPQAITEQSAEVGTGNSATGTGSFAAGNMSTANGTGAVALGNGATATGNGAMAFGNGASAAADGAVAIGPGAVADRANLIAIGGGGSTLRASGISSSASRTSQSGPVSLVTADAAGNLATTLLNVTELSGLAQRTTTLEGRVGELFDLANVQTKNMRQGVALATAKANPHFPSEAGKTSYASNIAYFRGEIGIAAGLMHRVDGDFAITAGAAYGGGDNIAVSAGIAGEF